MIPEARLQEIEAELVEAALALPYWPGRRVSVNYAPPLLRFLKAVDARAALTEESEDIHDSMWRASQEGRR